VGSALGEGFRLLRGWLSRRRETARKRRAFDRAWARKFRVAAESLVKQAVADIPWESRGPGAEVLAAQQVEELNRKQELLMSFDSSVILDRRLRKLAEDVREAASHTCRQAGLAEAMRRQMGFDVPGYPLGEARAEEYHRVIGEYHRSVMRLRDALDKFNRRSAAYCGWEDPLP
jgi:hypothetical protein